MLVLFFRALFALVFLRLLFRFVGGVISGLRSGAPQRRAPEAGVALVRDLVCNTFLPREKALVAVVGGQEVYFCSEECRRKGHRGAEEAGRR